MGFFEAEIVTLEVYFSPMLSSNTLLDNSGEAFMMVSALRELLADPNCKTLKIATGYWDIPGLSLLLPYLKDFLSREGTHVSLLLGSDPIVRASQLKNPLYKDAKFQQEYIKRDIRSLEVKEEYVQAVALLKEYCLEEEASSRFKIRMCTSDEDGDAQFFHAKCYIFLGPGYARGIIGSSNFTLKGLSGNAELNYLELSSAIVTAIPNENSPIKGHNLWFDQKWEISKSWNKYFLEEVLKGSPIETAQAATQEQNIPLTPYELYIKLLDYKFGALVDLDQQQMIRSYLPEGYQALDYQLQAVEQCFGIMREHGGFLLADVVGLGKTIVGSLVIKHFLTIPEQEGREHRVLVVSPPAIIGEWRETLQKFDLDKTEKIYPQIDFVTTGSIGKLLDEDALDEDVFEDVFEDDDAPEFEHNNYGLILIDESHKFRSNETAMYQALDALIASIGAETGAYPYIGLLSATPQNNRPKDLQNQIYLFERNHSDSTLKKALGGNLEGYFAEINRRYADIIRAPKDELGSPIELSESARKVQRDELKGISSSIRNCILDDILVRRTRTDINKYYDSVLKFPKISGPNSLEYKMNEGLAKLFAQTMDYIARTSDELLLPGGEDAIQYYRYRAIEFILDPQTKQLYQGGNLDPDRYSRQLAKIMQINLVKRLESSFTAFKASLNNLRQYTRNMIDMWENDAIFICPEIDVNAELDRKAKTQKKGRYCSLKECFEDLRAKIKKLDQSGRNFKGRNRELHRADFREDYIEKIRRDYDLLGDLCDKWSVYSNDPKLDTFKINLLPTLFSSQRNPTQKLVIFTEALDTVNAVKDAIESIAPQLKVLAVCAANRDALRETIRKNFDANYSGEFSEEYQVIITTEVLAEGVNLHRANTILNYDTPWNATRLMQRIGRVNRIGSKADTVYVYNFMPSAQGDAEIQLVRKAYTKLQSFHTLFGEDSRVFTEDEEIAHYDLNTVINGDESPMEKYIATLKEYKAAKPERYKQIAAATEGLTLATEGPCQKSYFLVRNSLSCPQFVEVGADLSNRMLSDAEALESFNCPPSTVCSALPEDYPARKAAAERAAGQALVKRRLTAINSAKATAAKEVILSLKNEPCLSTASKALLSSAFNLIGKGNADIIRKVLAIGKQKDEPSLFALTQSDINELIYRELETILSSVQKRYGKSEIFLSISK